MLDIDGPNIYVSTLNGSEGFMSFSDEFDEHFFYGINNITYMNDFSIHKLNSPLDDEPKFREKPKKVRLL